MDNSQISDNFSLLSKLLDIHAENNFKAKSYASAAFNIEKLPLQLCDTPKEKIFKIKGIGESSSKIIIELLETGTLKILQEMIEKTPEGVIEMLKIKGIGPKKAQAIFEGIHYELPEGVSADDQPTLLADQPAPKSLV